MVEETKCWHCGADDLIYSPKVFDGHYNWCRVVECKKCKRFKIIMVGEGKKFIRE